MVILRAEARMPLIRSFSTEHMALASTGRGTRARVETLDSWHPEHKGRARAVGEGIREREGRTGTRDPRRVPGRSQTSCARPNVTAELGFECSRTSRCPSDTRARSAPQFDENARPPVAPPPTGNPRRCCRLLTLLAPNARDGVLLRDARGVLSHVRGGSGSIRGERRRRARRARDAPRGRDPAREGRARRGGHEEAPGKRRLPRGRLPQGVRRVRRGARGAQRRLRGVHHVVGG